MIQSMADVKAEATSSGSDAPLAPQPSASSSSSSRSLQDIWRSVEQIQIGGKSLKDWGWLANLYFHKDALYLVLNLPTHPPVATEEIVDRLRQHLAQHAGITNIRCQIRRAPPARRTPPAQTRSPQPAQTTGATPRQTRVTAPIQHWLAIASGKGGVGKTTVAVALAWYFRHHFQWEVGILDADLFGPSIPTLLQLNVQRVQAELHEGKPRLIPPQWEGIPLMSLGFFIKEDQPVLWRGPVASGTVRQLVQDVAWQPLEALFIDLPPGTSDIPMTAAQSLPLTGVIIVSTPHPLAWADVRRAVAMFRHPALRIPILGIVENMAYFTPADQPEKRYYLFGKPRTKELAQQLEVPFLGSLPWIAPPAEEKPLSFTDMITHPAFLTPLAQIARHLKEKIALLRTQKNTTTKPSQTNTGASPNNPTT